MLRLFYRKRLIFDMRKIILNLCMSLDGFIEGPNGEFDWCFTDQDYGMSDFLARIDTIFFGRHSFDVLQATAPEAFSDKQKIIFSNSLNPKDSKHPIIGENWQKTVEEMLQIDGKDIWLFGGASLTSAMLQANLIDELMIAVHPLILGAGKPLFLDISNRKQLELIDTKTYSSGLVQLVYKMI